MSESESEPESRRTPEPAPEPDPIQFSCIGCGTLNPAGATVCAGCGYEFGRPLGPMPVAQTPAPTKALTPRRFSDEERNPYEAPAGPPGAHAPRFRLSTAMVLIGVIAVGLGAFSIDESLGVFSLIGLVPAMIRMMVVSARADGEGRPLTVLEMCQSLILTFLTSYAVVLASLIAFGMTCVPVGVASGNLGVAIGAGVLVMIPVGIWLVRVSLRAARGAYEARRKDAGIYWR